MSAQVGGPSRINREGIGAARAVAGFGFSAAVGLRNRLRSDGFASEKEVGLGRAIHGGDNHSESRTCVSLT